MKLAFADDHRYVADPHRQAVPVEELLSEEYAAARRGLILRRGPATRAGRARSRRHRLPCAADATGMMVSYIQSSFDGFGSHVVVPAPASSCRTAERRSTSSSTTRMSSSGGDGQATGY